MRRLAIAVQPSIPLGKLLLLVSLEQTRATVRIDYTTIDIIHGTCIISMIQLTVVYLVSSTNGQ